MRSTRLLGPLLGLACACGSDTVTIDPPLTCEPGPVLTASVVDCTLTTEGSGGPVAVRLWRFEAEQISGDMSFAPAPDGSVYVFARDTTADAPLVARFGPGFEFLWSRRLIDTVEVENPSSNSIRAHALGPDGVHVITRAERATLAHIDEDGNCSTGITLEFGGDPEGSARNLVRDGDRVVVTGTGAGITEYRFSSGYVQHRELDGQLVEEVEVFNDFYDSVDSISVLLGGPARYLVTYGGYAPQGIWSSYSAVQLLDESLAMVEGYPGSTYGYGYRSDVHGRLHSLTIDPWDPILEPEGPLPPTVYVTRLATPDEPGGETVDLSIPQPECGQPKLVLFDESRQLALCNPDESAPMLLGYEGSGPPISTTTLSCPDAPDMWLGQGQFEQDGRLWLHGGLPDVLLVVEF